jgi:predicted dehydrogenase
MADGLRIGLVGCGRIAEVGYLPALRRARGVRLAAVADPDEARRTLAAGGRPAFASAEALIASGEIDAVLFASPAHGRMPAVMAAWTAGLPTLVEKPPALTAAEAHTLARLDPAPWVAFNRRFEPRLRAMRAGLAKVARFDLRLRLDYRRASWRPHAVADEVLVDLGPHLVDLTRWLSRSEVTEARVLALSPCRAEFELQVHNGFARVSCASDRPYRESVAALDPAGRMLASWRTGGPLAALPARLRSITRGHRLVETLASQLEAFARAARGDSAGDLATAADGAAAMTAIEAVRGHSAAAEAA